jgi:hypothetical protein
VYIATSVGGAVVECESVELGRDNMEAEDDGEGADEVGGKLLG